MEFTKRFCLDWESSIHQFIKIDDWKRVQMSLLTGLNFLRLKVMLSEQPFIIVILYIFIHYS